MRKTVLIVDDHADFRASARAMLEAEGYEIVGEAATGAEAIAEAARLQASLVILDVRLPDVSGFQVADLLTGLDHAPSVVLISSRDAQTYQALVESSTARGFITKSELTGAALEDLIGE